MYSGVNTESMGPGISKGGGVSMYIYSSRWREASLTLLM